jgi:hypothetical protein
MGDQLERSNVVTWQIIRFISWWLLFVLSISSIEWELVYTVDHPNCTRRNLTGKRAINCDIYEKWDGVPIPFFSILDQRNKRWLSWMPMSLGLAFPNLRWLPSTSQGEYNRSIGWLAHTIAVQCCAEDHAKINRFFAKEENGVKLFFLKNYSGKVTHHSNSTQRSPTYTENNDPTWIIVIKGPLGIIIAWNKNKKRDWNSTGGYTRPYTHPAG